MSIIKRSKRITPFVQIDREALQNKCLSWKSKGLLGYLLSLPDDWQIYVSELKQHATDGRDSTANALKELIKNGYVTREKVQNKDTGRFEGYNYTVYDQPVISFEKPKPENPETDKPETGNPSTDNPITEEPITGSPNSENPQLQIIHNTNKEDTDKQKDTNGKQSLPEAKEEKIKFDNFWDAYSYKKNRATAKKSWDRLKLEDQQKAIAAVPQYLAYLSYSGQTQCHGSTWLNNKRWEDDNSIPAPTTPQPLQPEQDDYQLSEKWEESYQRGLEAYNKREVAKRISYFNRRDFLSWYAGKEFRIYNTRMIKEKIHAKIASVVSGLDSMPIYRNAQGQLSDFVKNAFTGKIRELG